MTRSVLLALLSCLLFACDDGGTDAPNPAKGAEEGALSDYEADSKADSWRQPTEHGALLPGRLSTAAFTDDALFHAWTVELSESAAVDLAVTSGDRNLDTVAYLYRQDPQTGYWGSYIAKNDDADDTVQSRISATLEAGRYRLMVKGYKRALRGDFAVSLTCNGAGCPGADAVEPTVGTPGYSVECADSVRDVLMSEITGTGYNYVAAKDIADLPPLQKAAAEFFIDSALEWADEDEISETDLEIGALDMVGGSRIDITTGADWSYSYLFDSAGGLLIEYFNDQSPIATFYCGGGTPAEAPGEWCAGGMLDTLPHKAHDIQTVDPAAVPAELTHLVALGEALYRKDAGLDDSAALTWAFNYWKEVDFAGQLTVEAEGQAPITYLLGGDEWNAYVYFSEAGDGLLARCVSKDDL